MAELPKFMHVHPAFVTKNVTNQQLNTTAGNMQDNGSAHRHEAKPDKTPNGKTKGVVGSAARTAKRKVPRSRMNDGGGKGAPVRGKGAS